MAQQAFEDVYLFVLDVDGDACADNLRYTMDDTNIKPLVTGESNTVFRQASMIGFRADDSKEIKRNMYLEDSNWNCSLLDAVFLPD
jgi:hypothetical protein